MNTVSESEILTNSQCDENLETCASNRKLKLLCDALFPIFLLRSAEKSWYPFLELQIGRAKDLVKNFHCPVG